MSCGCEMKRRAAAGDPDMKVIARHDAERACDAWACPGASPVEPTGERPPHLRLLLKDAEALTGAKGLRTCPLWYASLPWVHRAVRANAWREKGQLDMIEPEPPYTLMQAVDLVAEGQAREFREQRKRQENKGRGDGG